jgi:hypothetical protein
MPTITVPTDKLIIPLDGYSTVNWGGANGVIGASNGGLAVMFIPQETFTLTNIIFFYTINTAPSPATFDVGIQGFNATTGLPDGTFQTSGTWTAPSTGSGFANVSVTSFSMVKGADYYIVIRNATSGFSGSVSITISPNNATTQKVAGSHTRTSGVWSGASTRPGGCFWLYSGTKYYGYGCYPISGSATARSSPNEIGTTFQLPANHPTLTLRSMQFYTVSPNAGTTYEVRVRNAAGTLLATSGLDGDFVSTGSTPYFEFDTPVDFVAGTKYYIMLTGTSGTPPLMRTCTNFSGALMTDIRGGIVANLVEYNGTTFTETTAVTCQGYLMFDAIKYDQTGGTTTYSLPAGFNQLDF